MSFSVSGLVISLRSKFDEKYKSCTTNIENPGKQEVQVEKVSIYVTQRFGIGEKKNRKTKKRRGI